MILYLSIGNAFPPCGSSPVPHYPHQAIILVLSLLQSERERSYAGRVHVQVRSCRAGMVASDSVPAEDLLSRVMWKHLADARGSVPHCAFGQIS